MKILITYGTRPLAQRLARLLQTEHEVVLATCEEIPTVLKNFQVVPKANNSTFAHEVLKLCLDLGVDYVVPLSVAEIYSLHEARVLFGEYGILALVPEVLEGVHIAERLDATQPLYLFAGGVDMLSGTDAGFANGRIGLYTRLREQWHLVTV